MKIGIRCSLDLDGRLFMIGQRIPDAALRQHRLCLQLLADQSIFFLQPRRGPLLRGHLLVYPERTGKIPEDADAYEIVGRIETDPLEVALRISIGVTSAIAGIETRPPVLRDTK